MQLAEAGVHRVIAMHPRAESAGKRNEMDFCDADERCRIAQRNEKSNYNDRADRRLNSIPLHCSPLHFVVVLYIIYSICCCNRQRIKIISDFMRR